MYNEDLILQLNSALSSVREALDITTANEQTNATISNSDRAANVVIIKAAVSSATTTLKAIDTSQYEGQNAPDPVESEIIFISTPSVTAGASTLMEAHTITYDHNGVEVNRGLSSFLNWTSSDTTVAGVAVNGDRLGVVTGVSEGNITLTVTHRNSGALASLPVVVGPEV